MNGFYLTKVIDELTITPIVLWMMKGANKKLKVAYRIIDPILTHAEAPHLTHPI